MKLQHSQKGMTFLGLAVVLGILAFFVLLVLRLAPSYMEFFNVKSSMDSLVNEAGITQQSPSEIKKLIDRRFLINDVKNTGRDDVTITKDGGVLTVSIEYEVRNHVMGNVDAVMMFDHSVELVRN